MAPLGLSISETGKALGGEGHPLSRTTVWRLCKRGELDAIKIGTRTLVTTESIERLAANAPRVAIA